MVGGDEDIMEMEIGADCRCVSGVKVDLIAVGKSFDGGNT